MFWRSDPLSRILSSGFRGMEFASVVAGVFLGMLLMLLSLEFYFDVGDILASDSALDRNETVLIAGKIDESRRVAEITEETIHELADIPSVRDVGIFRKNHFELNAYVRLGAVMGNYYTEMFFESVPDRFLDQTDESWRWDTDSKTIPIIIPNDFLTMYNFGFAPARGLPRITPETIKKFPIGIQIDTDEGSVDYRAKVCGFTNRIQSIIVPESFLQWANVTYAPGSRTDIRKLILEVSNPDSKELHAFLEQKDLEIVSGASPAGKIRVFVRFAFLFTGIMGGLILLLAIGMYVLSIRLYMKRSEKDIRLLFLLGYRHGKIFCWLFRRLSLIFALTLVISFAAMMLLQDFIATLLMKYGMSGSLGIQNVTWYSAAALLVFVILLNRLLIRRQLNQSLQL